MNLFDEDESSQVQDTDSSQRIAYLTNNLGLKIGDIFESKYQVLSVLGIGGMSCVVLVKHIVLGKNYAIKILLPHLMGSTVNVMRFKQEASSVINLDHPNIISIYDCDVSKSGQPFIVMDFLEGIPLSQYIKENSRLDYKLAVKAFIQIADALAQAHESGLIHRDMKPSNIHITKLTDNDIKIVVLDFGIAKSVDENNEEFSKLTQTGEVFGSPAYMSPEQAKGEKLDYRTDIYSFGCLMYETLTGKLPFFSNSFIETVQKHISEPMPPFEKSCPGCKIPKQVELIVYKCLAKEPTNRYQTMLDLKNDLEKVNLNKTNNISDFLINIRLFLMQLIKPKTITAAIVSIALFLTSTLIIVGLVYVKPLLSDLPNLDEYFNQKHILDLLQTIKINQITYNRNIPSTELAKARELAYRYSSPVYLNSKDFDLEEFTSSLIDLATLELDSGDFFHAIEHFQTVLSKYPQNLFDHNLENIYNGLWKAYLFKYIASINTDNAVENSLENLNYLKKAYVNISKLNKANYNNSLTDEDIVFRQKALVYLTWKIYQNTNLNRFERKQYLNSTINQMLFIITRFNKSNDITNFFHYNLALMYNELQLNQKSIQLLKSIKFDNTEKSTVKIKFYILKAIDYINLKQFDSATNSLESAKTLLGDKSNTNSSLDDLRELVNFEDYKVLEDQNSNQAFLSKLKLQIDIKDKLKDSQLKT